VTVSEHGGPNCFYLHGRVFSSVVSFDNIDVRPTRATCCYFLSMFTCNYPSWQQSCRFCRKSKLLHWMFEC